MAGTARYRFTYVTFSASATPPFGSSGSRNGPVHSGTVCAATPAAAAAAAAITSSVRMVDLW